MKNILLSVVVVMGLLLAACNKTKIVHYPLNAALVAAFNFQPGSYWIYKDSLSGDIDSFFVRANVPSTNSGEDAQSTGEMFNYIDIAISEYNIFPATSPNDTASWLYIYCQDAIYLQFFTKKMYTGYICYPPLTDYPFLYRLTESRGVNYGQYSSGGSVDTIYNTYPVNGQTFTSVEMVNEYADVDPNGSSPIAYTYNDLFYISPNIGIIKMVLNHPQDSLHRIWELQRWSVKLK
jgi:hypothetical protein